ncbi:hypothetical protein M885DRAFT_534950, partial [Pelagophyceae sp. CCMP2097]
MIDVDVLGRRWGAVEVLEGVVVSAQLRVRILRRSQTTAARCRRAVFRGARHWGRERAPERARDGGGVGRALPRRFRLWRVAQEVVHGPPRRQFLALHVRHGRGNVAAAAAARDGAAQRRRRAAQQPRRVDAHGRLARARIKARDGRRRHQSSRRRAEAAQGNAPLGLVRAAFSHCRRLERAALVLKRFHSRKRRRQELLRPPLPRHENRPPRHVHFARRAPRRLRRRRGHRPRRQLVAVVLRGGGVDLGPQLVVRKGKGGVKRVHPTGTSTNGLQEPSLRTRPQGDCPFEELRARLWTQSSAQGCRRLACRILQRRARPAECRWAARHPASRSRLSTRA